MAHSHTPEAHAKIRRDHAQETAEDYVEAVADLLEERGTCRVVDLAERFGVSHVTALRVVQRLVGEDLLATEPRKPIELTAAGRKLAAACAERHEAVYRFLRKLGVSKKVATLDAEGIEHHLSKPTLKAMRAFTQD